MARPDAFCKGDSGGALFILEENRYNMIGVVSSKLRTHPSSQCDAYYPGIYVRLDHPGTFNFIKSKAFKTDSEILEFEKTMQTLGMLLCPDIRHVDILFCFSGKLVVVTGSSDDWYSSTILTEVFDLENENNLCHAPPFETFEGATGGAVNESTALICGGYDGRDYKTECYTIGKDGSNKAVVNLKVPRRFASSVVDDAQDLLVFGGFNYQTGAHKTIEKVSLNTRYSRVIGELPFTFHHGCVLRYGQNIIIIGGNLQNEYISSSTWISSIGDLNNWNQGPELQQERDMHACAFLPNFNVGFATGGSWTLSSTELIDLTEQSVVQGYYSFKVQNI